MKQKEVKIAVGWSGLRKENLMRQKGDYNKYVKQKILLLISSMASCISLALVCQ